MERLRRVTSGPADRDLTSAKNADDRIVGSDVNRPIVRQEKVCDRREALEGIVVRVRDGLIGDIAAGEHERSGELIA
jgi:hypothetical protein